MVAFRSSAVDELYAVDRVRRPPLLRAERRRTRQARCRRVTSQTTDKKEYGARDPGGTDGRFGRRSLFFALVYHRSGVVRHNVVSSNTINMHVRYRVRTSDALCSLRTTHVACFVRFSNTVLDDRKRSFGHESCGFLENVFDDTSSKQKQLYTTISFKRFRTQRRI